LDLSIFIVSAVLVAAFGTAIVVGAPVPLTVPLLLVSGAGSMTGLLFYALLETEPPVAYIVGVVAAVGVTGWAALKCLLCDWEDRGRLAPSLKPGGAAPDAEPTVHAPAQSGDLEGLDAAH
jgi:hypothetical protein